MTSSSFVSSVPASPPTIPPEGYISYNERQNDAQYAAVLLEEDAVLKERFDKGDNTQDLEESRNDLEKKLFALANRYGLRSIENLPQAIRNTDPYIE